MEDTYNWIVCFVSDATMDDENPRQMQAFQSLGSLGKCISNQDASRSHLDVWVKFARKSHDSMPGEGGPGFLTPDAITLLGLLTLAVLLIRQVSHYLPQTSSKSFSSSTSKFFVFFVLTELARNTIGILDTGARSNQNLQNHRFR